jgi:hypothetical protein
MIAQALQDEQDPYTKLCDLSVLGFGSDRQLRIQAWTIILIKKIESLKLENEEWKSVLIQGLSKDKDRLEMSSEENVKLGKDNAKRFMDIVDKDVKRSMCHYDVTELFSDSKRFVLISLKEN